MENYSHNSLKFTVLGARGSVPVGGEGFNRYAGNTSCYMIEHGNEQIFLDAGTGIIRAPYKREANVTVLLSHLHIDHLIGFPFFTPLFDKGRTVNIYAAQREGGNLKDQLNNLFVPPFWPLRIDDYIADIDYRVPQFPFKIGDISVDGMEGNHPGGCTIYKFMWNGHSIVFMTDYEHSEDGFSRELIEFVEGADLLLYDAQYTEEEYPSHKGYGHSTPEKGLEFMRLTDAKNMYFIHHDPSHDDYVLDKLESKYGGYDVHYARYNDEFILS